MFLDLMLGASAVALVTIMGFLAVSVEVGNLHRGVKHAVFWLWIGTGFVTGMAAMIEIGHLLRSVLHLR